MFELAIAMTIALTGFLIMSAVAAVVGDEFLEFVANWEKKRKGR